MIAEQLKAARRQAGLTQRELAKKARLSAMSISKYERAVMSPRGETLARLARALGVPAARLVEPLRPMHMECLSQRTHPRVVKKRGYLDSVRGQLTLELSRRRLVEDLAGTALPQPGVRAELRQLVEAERGRGDAEAAAGRLRAHWSLGLDPIESVVDVFEDHGIEVVVVDAPSAEVNASIWDIDGCLVVAVNRRLPSGQPCPGDRERFSLAHELGHVLLDPDEAEGKSLRERERLADRFAAAFLVPRDAAFRELGDRRTRLPVPELAMLKQKYGLSMQAWVRRAVELGILKGRAADRALGEIAERGWEQWEPCPLPFEEPRRLRALVLRAWAEDRLSTSRAAELTGIPVQKLLYSDVEAALEGLRA